MRPTPSQSRSRTRGASPGVTGTPMGMPTGTPSRGSRPGRSSPLSAAGPWDVRRPPPQTGARPVLQGIHRGGDAQEVLQLRRLPRLSQREQGEHHRRRLAPGAQDRRGRHPHSVLQVRLRVVRRPCRQDPLPRQRPPRHQGAVLVNAQNAVNPKRCEFTAANFQEFIAANFNFFK